MKAMSFRTLTTANGVVSLIFGILGVALPALLVSLYGVTPTERETALVQMLGAAYVGFGGVLWGVRGSADGRTRTVVAVGALASWALSLVVGLMWTRLTTGIAWPTVAMQAAFVLGWAYVLLTSRNAFGTVRP